MPILNFERFELNRNRIWSQFNCWISCKWIFEPPKTQSQQIQANKIQIEGEKLKSIYLENVISTRMVTWSIPNTSLRNAMNTSNSASSSSITRYHATLHRYYCMVIPVSGDLMNPTKRKPISFLYTLVWLHYILPIFLTNQLTRWAFVSIGHIIF